MSDSVRKLKPEVHPQLGKIGFVLTGGSLRGAFQVGALEALQKNGIIPSYIAGVSVGAMNAAAFAAGQIDLLVKTFQDIATSPREYFYKWSVFSLLRVFFWSSSMLVNTPLRRVLKERIAFGDFFSSGIKVDVLTTDFQSGEQLVFSNHRAEHQDEELFLNVLLGSSAIPVIFPPFDYKGHQLFDGSVIETTPIRFAVEQQCDTIFVIVTDPLEHRATKRIFKTIYAVSGRFGSLISSRSTSRSIRMSKMINRDIQAYEKLKSDLTSLIDAKVKDPGLAKELKEGVLQKMNQKVLSVQDKRFFKVFVIEPEQFLESDSSIFFTHQMIPHYLDEGYNKTMKLLRRLGVASTSDTRYAD